MILSKLLRTVLLISILLATSSEKSVSAQDSKDSLSVLFVGNSYIYVENLPHIVSLISEGSNVKLITRKSVVGGARLSEHWNSKRGLKTMDIIKNGDFDIVVLQDFSMSAIDTPDSLMKYTGLFCDYIRENGGEPYLYVTWAREKVPQFQDQISKVYSEAAEKYDAVPVMVGDAWALAKAYRPTIKLFSSDGSHQGDLGAYLTASVFVQTISGSLPEQMPLNCKTIDYNGESVRLMHVDLLDGVFFKKIAEEITGEPK